MMTAMMTAMMMMTTMTDHHDHDLQTWELLEGTRQPRLHK